MTNRLIITLFVILVFVPTLSASQARELASMLQVKDPNDPNAWNEVGDFLDAIKVNAGHSVAREPGCRQFDVCVDPARGERVYLYEVYDKRTKERSRPY